MRFELKRIQRDLGITTVYVTHDQTEALAHVEPDRGDVARHRSSRTATPVRSITGRPRTFVADFIGTSNFLRGVVEEAAGPNRWQVASEVGEIEVESESIGLGDKVTISIRPEHVKMVPASPDTPAGHGRRGRIEARAFQGDSVLHRVRVGDQVVSVQCNPSVTFSKDDEVDIAFPSAWCTVIAELVS